MLFREEEPLYHLINFDEKCLIRKQDLKISISARGLYLRRAVFWGLFPETWDRLLLLLPLFTPRVADAKRSPARRWSIILLVKKFTTLLKSPGLTCPWNFLTFKAFRVIPASSAMSLRVYLYSTFGLYGWSDFFLGILTSYTSLQRRRASSESHRLFSISLPRIESGTQVDIPSLTLAHNSDTILTSKRVFNLFQSIWVIMPDSINPETVLTPSRG